MINYNTQMIVTVEITNKRSCKRKYQEGGNHGNEEERESGKIRVVVVILMFLLNWSNI